jgi:hypothetical protein
MRTPLYLLVLLSAACKPAEPKATFDKMHEAACSGDADKFFVHTDEETMLDNMIKRAVRSDTAMATKTLGAEGVRAIAREATDAWRKDITTKSKDGDICGWSFVTTERIGDLDRVEIRTKAGNKKLVYFRTVGDATKLVDFQASEPATTGDR